MYLCFGNSYPSFLRYKFKWIDFIWLRVGSNAGILWKLSWIVWFNESQKCLEQASKFSSSRRTLFRQSIFTCMKIFVAISVGPIITDCLPRKGPVPLLEAPESLCGFIVCRIESLFLSEPWAESRVYPRLVISVVPCVLLPTCRLYFLPQHPISSPFERNLNILVSLQTCC